MKLPLFHTSSKFKSLFNEMDTKYSKNELNVMFFNLQTNGLGGFAIYYYWSSTEYGFSSAWRQIFSDGGQVNYPKNHTFYVRAVRAF